TPVATQRSFQSEFGVNIDAIASYAFDDITAPLPPSAGADWFELGPNHTIHQAGSQPGNYQGMVWQWPAPSLRARSISFDRPQGMPERGANDVAYLSTQTHAGSAWIGFVAERMGSLVVGRISDQPTIRIQPAGTNPSYTQLATAGQKLVAWPNATNGYDIVELTVPEE